MADKSQYVPNTLNIYSIIFVSLCLVASGLNAISKEVKTRRKIKISLFREDVIRVQFMQ